MTLAEFLAARLDEDEADANDFHDALRCGGFDRDGGFDLRWCDCDYPARVLREVQAKRKILAAFVSFREEHERQRAALAPGSPGVGSGVHTGTQVLRDAVTALAAVCSDHPDYDPNLG
jgi:hypothetical protein